MTEGEVMRLDTEKIVEQVNMESIPSEDTRFHAKRAGLYNMHVMLRRYVFETSRYNSQVDLYRILLLPKNYDRVYSGGGMMQVEGIGGGAKFSR